VLNLVDNAVEAVGGTGDVRVETAHVAETGARAYHRGRHGPGISPEDKEKLFLPYFSTKVARNGGSGLPIVHEIVSEHGGTIWIEDNAPKGNPLRHRGSRLPAPASRSRPENDARTRRPANRRCAPTKADSCAGVTVEA